MYRSGLFRQSTEGFGMKEALVLFGAMTLWFVVSKWVLPRMGVPT